MNMKFKRKTYRLRDYPDIIIRCGNKKQAKEFSQGLLKGKIKGF